MAFNCSISYAYVSMFVCMHIYPHTPTHNYSLKPYDSVRPERHFRSHQHNTLLHCFTSGKTNARRGSVTVYRVAPVVKGMKSVVSSLLPISHPVRCSVKLARLEAWRWSEVCTWPPPLLSEKWTLLYFLRTPVSSSWKWRFLGLGGGHPSSCRFLLSTGLKSSIHRRTQSPRPVHLTPH